MALADALERALSEIPDDDAARARAQAEVEAAIQEEIARIDPVDFGLIAEETAQGIKVRLSPRDELAVKLQVFPPVPDVTFLATFGGESKEWLVDLIVFLRTQAPIHIL